MVDLQSTHDYVVLLFIAAVFGALGGLAYELLLTRGQEAGGVEWPGRRKDVPNYLDLGFLGSMFLGAVAAIAISYFFTPEVQVKATEHGTDVIKTQWQIVKVVPLSLIVGSAGGAFLTAMQARVVARLKEQETEATKKMAQAVIGQVGTGTKQVATAAATAAVEKLGTTAEQTVKQAAKETSPELVRQLDDLATGAPYEAEIREVVGLPASTTTGEHLERLHNAKTEAVAEAAEKASAAIDEQVEAASKSLQEAMS